MLDKVFKWALFRQLKLTAIDMTYMVLNLSKLLIVVFMAVVLQPTDFSRQWI